MSQKGQQDNQRVQKCYSKKPKDIEGDISLQDSDNLFGHLDINEQEDSIQGMNSNCKMNLNSENKDMIEMDDIMFEQDLMATPNFQKDQNFPTSAIIKNEMGPDFYQKALNPVQRTTDLRSRRPVVDHLENIRTSNFNSQVKEKIQIQDQKLTEIEKRLISRRSKFQFSKISIEEQQYHERKAKIWMVFLLYFAIVIAQLWFFVWRKQMKGEEIKTWVFIVSYLPLLIGINAIGIFTIGSTAVRGIVFPYSLWLSKHQIIGSNCIRYGEEFMQLVEKSYVLMRVQMMKTFTENDHSKYTLEKLKQYETSYLQSYDARQINQKMLSLVSLSKMFAETNLRVIEIKRAKLQRVDSLFKKITEVHDDMTKIFASLECRILDAWNIPFEMTIDEYYKEDQQAFNENRVPQIKNNEYNSKQMDRLEVLSKKFRLLIEETNSPMNFGCFRSNLLGLYYKNIFHSNDQTENMLEKIFDGRRFWVKAKDGTKLDCMFFPFNDEKVLTIDELKRIDKHKDIENQTPLEYTKYPTVIFFSPNAQCYQQQVHSPNCFWLKFFVQNNINVMAWNYRNYGRSGGTPDPFLCLHDSESILKFLIKDLGLIGKIGCFGRSLGGTMASHLANNFGQHIDFLFVDRSLGSLQTISQRLILGSYTESAFNLLSQGWSINNAKNFYEAKCFKMLTQDPKDDTIDQFCALNSQVACFACRDEIGKTRYTSLKIEKSYNALRMLFMVENKLLILIKHQSKFIKKNQKAKRQQQKQQIIEQNNYDSTGYPSPTQNLKRIIDIQPDVAQTPLKDNKSAGYSTDVDQLHRSKRLLELENKWKQMIQSNKISQEKLDHYMRQFLKDNFKQYENFSIVLQRVVVFISDLEAGILQFGEIVSPNMPHNHLDLQIFVDNLFTYGSSYMDNSQNWSPLDHRQQRINSIKSIAQIIQILKKSKEEVKNTLCKFEEDSLKQIVHISLKISLNFFETLFKQLKKSESYINFEASDLGHLVALSVGHTDKPTDEETRYIRTLMKNSGFKYDAEEFVGVSPSPLQRLNIQSGVIPKIHKSPDIHQRQTQNNQNGPQPFHSPRLEKAKNSYVDGYQESKITSTKKELIDLADSQAKKDVIRDSTTKPFSFGIKLQPTQLKPPQSRLQQLKMQTSYDSKKMVDSKEEENQQKSCKSLVQPSIKSFKSYQSEEEKDDIASTGNRKKPVLKSVKSFSQYEGQPIQFVKSSFIIKNTIHGMAKGAGVKIQKQNSTGQRKSKKRRQSRNEKASKKPAQTARSKLHNRSIVSERIAEPPKMRSEYMSSNSRLSQNNDSDRIEAQSNNTPVTRIRLDHVNKSMKIQSTFHRHFESPLNTLKIKGFKLRRQSMSVEKDKENPNILTWSGVKDVPPLRDTILDKQGKLKTNLNNFMSSSDSGDEIIDSIVDDKNSDLIKDPQVKPQKVILGVEKLQPSQEQLPQDKKEVQKCQSMNVSNGTIQIEELQNDQSRTSSERIGINFLAAEQGDSILNISEGLSSEEEGAVSVPAKGSRSAVDGEDRLKR